MRSETNKIRMTLPVVATTLSRKCYKERNKKREKVVKYEI